MDCLDTCELYPYHLVQQICLQSGQLFLESFYHNKKGGRISLYPPTTTSLPTSACSVLRIISVPCGTKSCPEPDADLNISSD